MIGLKNKLLLMSIIYALVPSILIGVISYLTIINNYNNKVYDTLYSIIVQTTNNLDYKLEAAKKHLDFIFINEKLQEILVEEDMSKLKITSVLKYKLDEQFNMLFYFDDNVMNAFLFSQKGGSYSYKGIALSESGLVYNKDWYKEIVNNEGKISWIGLYHEDGLSLIEKPSFIVGRQLYDIFYNGSLEVIGTLVVFYDADVILGSFDEHNSLNSYNIIFDNKGKVVHSDMDISHVESMAVYDSLVNQNGKIIIRKINGEKHIVLHDDIQINGWSLVNIVPYSSIINEISKIRILSVIIFIFSLTTVYIFSDRYSRYFTAPIKLILNAMKDLGKKDFSVSVCVKTKDEMGMLCEGFNKMVKDICELFDLAIIKEKEKRKAQVRALQYQLNPHFIHNTLNVIKIVVNQNNADKAVDMIRSLSRLLKNTLSQDESYITVTDEINNIKEYVNVQNMQYEKKAVLNIKIEKEAQIIEIPRMLLQPVIENAFFHGLNKKLNSKDNKNDAVIEVEVYIINKVLNIDIVDNGIGMSPEKVCEVIKHCSEYCSDDIKHIGLKNIHRRITIEYGEQYGITMKSKQNSYTVVSLTFPSMKEGE